MNFCSRMQDESEIITKIEKIDNNRNYYVIHYLDGREVTLYNQDEFYITMLGYIMLDQAIERDRRLYKLRKEDFYKSIFMSFMIIMYCLSCTIMTRETDKRMLYTMYLLFEASVSVWSIKVIKDNKTTLDELKKYRIYLNMRKELEKQENKDITKILETDPYRRKKLNINTIDDFTLRDVKIVKKELKRRSNNKQY